MRSCAGATGHPARYEKRMSAADTCWTLAVYGTGAANIDVNVPSRPMLVASHIAAAAIAAACPGNVANDLRRPPPGSTRQLITVEAATTRATYATAQIWRRSGRCWVAAGGPYPARV